MTINVNSEGHLEMKADLMSEGAVTNARFQVECALELLAGPEGEPGTGNAWFNIDALSDAEQMLTYAAAQLAAVRRRAEAARAAAAKVQP